MDAVALGFYKAFFFFGAVLGLQQIGGQYKGFPYTPPSPQPPQRHQTEWYKLFLFFSFF